MPRPWPGCSWPLSGSSRRRCLPHPGDGCSMPTREIGRDRCCAPSAPAGPPGDRAAGRTLCLGARADLPAALAGACQPQARSPDLFRSDRPAPAAHRRKLHQGLDGLGTVLRGLYRQLDHPVRGQRHRQRPGLLDGGLCLCAPRFPVPEDPLRADAGHHHAAAPGDAHPTIYAVPRTGLGRYLYADDRAWFLAVDAFFVFLIVQFVRSIPRELDEAALIDGCGPFATYWRIIFPLLLPALVTTAIFTFLWTYDDFFSQLIYITSPEKFTVPLGLRVFLDTTGESAYGAMLAMSVVALVPAVAFFLIFQKRIVDGVATSGLKG
ncbi:MAG: carbohydrate ABC transporter permease [Devosia sp.]